MVKVGRLLEINSHHQHPHSFGQCLGDRYLYVKNPIYRKIRDYALQCGISYSFEGSLWHDYQVCPLFCLNLMLEAKSVPMIDNQVSLVRLVEKAGSSFFVSGKFLTKALKRNYLLHESSHYIAHCLIASAGHSLNTAGLTSELAVSAALLGEAFAAVTERIAWACAENPTHILLFNLNSYMDHKEPDHRVIVDCLQRVGQSSVSWLGMIALFLNNMKKRPVSDGEFDAILGHFFPQLQEHEVCEQLRLLVSRVFSITPAFLEETTPAYFRLLGLEDAFTTMSQGNYSMGELEDLMWGPVASQLLEVIAAPCERATIQMASTNSSLTPLVGE